MIMSRCFILPVLEVRLDLLNFHQTKTKTSNRKVEL